MPCRYWLSFVRLLNEINPMRLERFSVPKRNLKGNTSWNGIGAANIYDGHMHTDWHADCAPFERELADNQSWAVGGVELISSKSDLISALGSETAGGYIESISEASNEDGSKGGEKTIVTIDRPHNAKNVSTYDFSDDEAILMWICISLIVAPITYAFGKITRNCLFGPD